MKKGLAVFSAVLALSLASLAQDAATTATTSVTGCLAGSAGAYTLTDPAGKSYVLTGKTDDLAGHLGHQMEVTGQGPASNSSQTSSGTASFEVAGAKMIFVWRAPVGEKKKKGAAPKVSKKRQKDEDKEV